MFRFSRVTLYILLACVVIGSRILIVRQALQGNEETTSDISNSVQTQENSDQEDSLIVQENTTGTQVQTQEEREQTSTIHILAPAWLIHTGTKNIIQEYSQTNSLQWTWSLPANYEAYQQALERWKEGQWEDMALIPSQWMASYHPSAFDIRTRESLHQHYHTSSHSIMDQEGRQDNLTTDFIPYLIDPLLFVSYKTGETEENTQLRYGYDLPTLQRLQDQKVPYPWYFLQRYYLFAYFIRQGDSEWAQDYMQSQLDGENRSLINWLRYTKDYETAPCNNRKHVCLALRNNMVAIPFFQGDIRALTDQANIQDFAYTSRKHGRQPVQTRWWAIHEQSTQLVHSINIVNEIINRSLSGNIDHIPYPMAGAGVQQFQAYQNQTEEHTQRAQDDLQTIYGSQDRKNLFTSATNIIQVAEQTYNRELFLTNPGRDFD